VAQSRPVVAAILVAAGGGVRLGADVPKAFVDVGGRTLLEHAAQRMAAHPDVRDVVIVSPAERLESVRALVPAATVVPGGETRQQSVARGLDAVAPDVDAVLVHDVARAFTPPDVVTRVVDALAAGAAAVVPALPVIDTVKQVDEDGRVLSTLDRSRLRAIQTPQGFDRAVAVKAHALGGLDAPDDAALAEALGVTVVVVEGSEDAFKITRPRDLALARALFTELP
jgi:2-C-methyl-D-erythritol 4-phosphate cytidylyltransferase